MSRAFIMIFYLALVGLFAAGDASARPGDWEVLGEKRVGFLVDRDVIRVGRSEGRFSAIKLRVQDNDIEVLDLKVVYANGQSDTLPVRQFIRQGGETRAIDLKGNARAIREIQIVYRSRPSFKGQALVRVFGQEARGGQAGPGRPGQRDWERLGVTKVGFIKDTDVIKVGRSEGRFKRIKLRVRDNAIEMNRLVVVYGNGQREELQVRQNIPAGGETRAIDLKGDGRFIREVRMTYRSRPNFRGQATVELWGLRD